MTLSIHQNNSLNEIINSVDQSFSFTQDGGINASVSLLDTVTSLRNSNTNIKGCGVLSGFEKVTNNCGVLSGWGNN